MTKNSTNTKRIDKLQRRLADTLIELQDLKAVPTRVNCWKIKPISSTN